MGQQDHVWLDLPGGLLRGCQYPLRRRRQRALAVGNEHPLDSYLAETRGQALNVVADEQRRQRAAAELLGQAATLGHQLGGCRRQLFA